MNQFYAMMGFVLLFISGLPPRVSFAQDCSILMSGGIYDYDNVDVSGERSSSFVNWFRTLNASSKSSYESTTAGATIPIADILAGGSYSNDQRGFEQFYNDVSSYNSATSDTKSRVQASISNINQGVIRAVQACLANKALHAYVKIGADPNKFLFTMEYNTPGGHNIPLVQRIRITNADCDDSIKVGTIIDSAPITMQCSRRNSSQQVTITLGTNIFIQEGNAFILPPIPSPPPPPTFYGFKRENMPDDGAQAAICNELDRVPANQNVCLWLGGSWSEIPTPPGSGRIGVGVLDIHHTWAVTQVFLREADSGIDRTETTRPYMHPSKLTLDKDFYVCIAPPTPGPGRLRVVTPYDGVLMDGRLPKADGSC